MSSVTERAAASPTPVRRRRRVASVLQGLAIAVGFAMLVGGFGLIALDYRPYRVPTTSMSPTVEPGDTLLARKVGGGSVGRGDVVVFSEQAWGGATMVKRVVGVGGDTVASDPAGRISVNGTVIDETYSDAGKGVGAAFSVTVPEGRLFLLGDSRLNSLDSRSHLDVASGTVAATDVVAKVEAIAWPSSRASLLARTAAFDSLKGPAATRPGLLAPAGYAAVGGAALVLIAALMGWVATLVQRLARRRRA
ncbi:signal peptidase I [Kitasatospora sp. NPDC059571]|uniref:signal peptidase I n=1 Tax=Kitasatospora sp. NPDC059571 TaxID=3346871 RepID=UPI00367DE2E7